MTIMHAAVLNWPRIKTRRSKSQIIFSIRFSIIYYLSFVYLPRRLISNRDIGRADFANKVLTKTGPGILEKKDEFGWTPLHYAAYMGDEKVVELFLKENSFIAYSQNNKGMSALHISAQRGRVGVIRTLIQKFPDVCELLDDNDQTALHVAVGNNREDVVKEFLGMMPFSDLINEPDKDGNTCLHTAAFQGNRFILLMLANDNRVDIAAINNSGMTAVNIVWSNTQLDADAKGFIISHFKIRGLGLARVIEETRMALQLETSQVPAQNDKEAGESSTSISTERKIGGPTEQNPKEESKNPKEESKYFKDLSNVNLIVATIIASITFAAIIQMPGGYQSSNGMPILAKNRLFRIFLVCDGLAFTLSAASMCIHFLAAFLSRVLSKNYTYPVGLIYLLTCLFIFSTVLAAFGAMGAVLSKNDSNPSHVLSGRHSPFLLIGFSIFIIPVLFYVVYLIIIVRKRFYDED